jgi:D-beta-D-heptose 7-phosphate kinase/D-beta-D-heptose 1-phosphate adenosyltransferase
VLLISDYGKGVCTPGLLTAAIGAARRAGVPTVVDPARGCSLDHYHGVTVIKPNRVEAQLATGRKIARPADAIEAGRQLCVELEAQLALTTLDRDGMVLVGPDGASEVFPTHARAVYDITGAGDIVLAVFGMCLAAGVAPADAVRLSNVAAGLEVERAGVDVIYRDEIRAEIISQRGGTARKIVNLKQAAQAAEEYRRRGERIVFTNGCFDLLHVGHVTHLAEAAKLGDVLFVGVNSDASVRKLKGPSRPVIDQSDRAAMLAALSDVNHVIVFDEDTPHSLLHAIRPDVLVKGGTYTRDKVVGHEVVEAYGGTVCVTGVVDGISTTNILSSLARDQAAEPPASPAQDANTTAGDDGKPRLRRAG